MCVCKTGAHIRQIDCNAMEITASRIRECQNGDENTKSNHNQVRGVCVYECENKIACNEAKKSSLRNEWYGSKQLETICNICFVYDVNVGRNIMFTWFFFSVKMRDIFFRGIFSFRCCFHSVCLLCSRSVCVCFFIVFNFVIS